MIPLAKPWLGDEEAAAAGQAVLSGWVTQGPRVAEFEREVARVCGAPHAVAVSSCTTGLHLAVLALNIGPGDEVICPSMSFIATANAIAHAGATPVFADVDQRTFNLCPCATEAAITPRTKAIMPVHQIGLPADLDAFHDLSKRKGIPLIEDAACAIGSKHRGNPIGSHGSIAVLSFHPRKIITTGEGGMVLTHDPAIDARLRLLRQHGMSVPDTARHGAKRLIVESYEILGYNYRMTDIQAAVGLAQLRKLDRIIELRTHWANRYAAALQEIPWLLPPLVPDYAEPTFQSYAVTLTKDAPLSRDALIEHLLARGVSSKRGIMLAHREPPYAGRPHHLPRSERASDASLLLPLYPHMTQQEHDQVLAALRSVARGSY